MTNANDFVYGGGSPSLSSVAQKMGFDGWAAYAEPDVLQEGNNLAVAEAMQAHGFGEIESEQNGHVRGLEIVLDEPDRFLDLAFWMVPPYTRFGRANVQICDVIIGAEMAKHGVYVHEGNEKDGPLPFKQRARTITDVEFARRTNLLQNVAETLQDFCVRQQEHTPKDIVVVHPSLEADTAEIDQYLAQAGLEANAVFRRRMYMMRSYSILQRQFSQQDPQRRAWEYTFGRASSFINSESMHTRFFDEDGSNALPLLVEFGIQKRWVKPEVAMAAAEQTLLERSAWGIQMMLLGGGYVRLSQSQLSNKLGNAVRKGRSTTKVIQPLLALGADVDVRNKYGETPLLVAIGKKQKNMDQNYSEALAKTLLAAGADVDAKSDKGDTPISKALMLGSPANLDLVPLLLKFTNRGGGGELPIPNTIHRVSRGIKVP